MIKVPTYTVTGEKKPDTKLPEEVFGVSVNPDLLGQAVRVYLSNQRQGTKHAKSRSEVNRTTAKVWRQKGTGRARHGSRRAPIFVGGGVAHGPTGLENYQLKLTKKMRRLAILGALSGKVADNSVVIIDNIADLEPKTKNLQSLVNSINAKSQSSSVLIILDEPRDNVTRAARNAKTVSLTQAHRLNVYEILKAGQIALHLPAIAKLQQTFVTSKPKTKSAIDAKPKKEDK